MSKQNKVRGKSISRQLRDETEPFLSTKSFGTQKNYRKWLDAYIKYCREHHNCKTHDECFMHIQDYADYLQGKYSASTIHSFLAAVCGFYNVPMDLIAKPIRHTAEYTKSRSDNGKKIRADNNIDNPRYERSVGKVTDEWFMHMAHKYETERITLKSKIADYRTKLATMNTVQQSRDMFLKAVRKVIEMEALTAPLVRELIDHIDVYETQGKGKNKTQRVVIYYRFVGYIELPTNEDDFYKKRYTSGSAGQLYT